jgi:hypothetical protein
MKIHLKEERQQLVKMLEETKMFPVITVTVSIQLLLDTSTTKIAADSLLILHSLRY